MPGKRKPREPDDPVLPDFMLVPVDRILEPTLPARVVMDSDAMSELVESMRTLGQIEPVTLERHEGMYEIITGHRRYLAARELKWRQMKALVWPEGTPNRLAMMLHENVVRESLNPAEEAIFFAQCQEQLKLDEAGLVKTFRRSADYIAGRLALLRGDREVFLALQQGQIKVGVAHELNRITDGIMRNYYLDCAKRTDPPARVVHGWVQEWKIRELAQRASGAPGIERALADAAAYAQAGEASADGDGATAGAQQPAAPFFGCELCGGDRDPYNLVNVRIHRWEWERIQDTVRKAVGGA